MPLVLPFNSIGNEHMIFFIAINSHRMKLVSLLSVMDMVDMFSLLAWDMFNMFFVLASLTLSTIDLLNVLSAELLLFEVLSRHFLQQNDISNDTNRRQRS